MSIKGDVYHLSPKLTADEALNDSDKPIWATPNKTWRIFWIHVELLTTAVAGNRVLTLQIRDGADDIIYEMKGPNHAASTTVIYEFIPGATRETAASQGIVVLPLPDPCIIPAAATGLIWDLRIYDSAAIDAAADDMIIQMVHGEVDV